MVKFCPECANPIIESNMPFCPKCGTKLPFNSSDSQPVDKQKPSQEQETKKICCFDFLGIKVEQDSETKKLDMRLFGIDKIEDFVKKRKDKKPSQEKNRMVDFLGLKVEEDSETKLLDWRMTGIDIIDDALKNRPTTPYGGNSVKEAKKDLNYLGNIVFGILIILALYIFPIKTFEGRNFSIADLTSICSNPIGIMIGRSDCNLWNMVFYGGWVIAIVFIIFGVIQISRVGKYGRE